MQEVTEPQGSEAAPTTEATTASTPVDVDAVVARAQERLAQNSGKQEQAKEAKAEAKGPEAGTAVKEEAAPTDEAQSQEAVLTARQQAALFRQESELRKQREALRKENENLLQFRDAIRNNPIEALKQLGIDNASDIAAQIWNQALGENAPEEFRKQQKEKLLDAKAEEVGKKLQEYEQRLQGAVAQAEYNMRVQTKDEEIKSFIKDIPAEYKFVRRQAEKDPSAALKLFYDLAIGQIQQANWNFTAKDIARALNEELEAEVSTYKDLFSDPAIEDHVKPRKASKTLTNQETVEKPDKKEKKLTLNDPEWTERGVRVVEQILSQRKK